MYSSIVHLNKINSQCKNICLYVCVHVLIYVCIYKEKKKKKEKKGGPQVIRAVQGVNTHSQDIEKTSSVGDQLRDPKLPLYGSLYRGIATDH